jgi:hypothetical protein
MPGASLPVFPSAPCWAHPPVPRTWPLLGLRRRQRAHCILHRAPPRPSLHRRSAARRLAGAMLVLPRSPRMRPLPARTDCSAAWHVPHRGKTTDPWRRATGAVHNWPTQLLGARGPPRAAVQPADGAAGSCSGRARAPCLRQALPGSPPAWRHWSGTTATPPGCHAPTSAPPPQQQPPLLASPPQPSPLLTPLGPEGARCR